MKKYIKIGVYYIEDDKGKKILDEDSMREEFQGELEKLEQEINKN